jgi:hypothetical protein
MTAVSEGYCVIQEKISEIKKLLEEILARKWLLKRKFLVAWCGISILT